MGGNAKYEVTFNLNTLATRNQSVLGVSKGSRTQLQELVDLFAEGKVGAALISGLLKFGESRILFLEAVS